MNARGTATAVMRRIFDTVDGLSSKHHGHTSRMGLVVIAQIWDGLGHFSVKWIRSFAGGSACKEFWIKRPQVTHPSFGRVAL
jgi:hypothetical protein